MPSIIARLILFVSSYAPLLVLFALLDSFGTLWSRILCGSLALLSLIALIGYWRSLRRESSGYKTESVMSSAPRNLDVIGYFASYVIPFAAAEQHDLTERVSLLFLLAIIAGFYFRNDLYYANPVLALAGVRVFDVTTANGQSVLVLTHRRFVQQSGELKLLRLGSYIYLEEKNRA
jgi:hypothetical protein